MSELIHSMALPLLACLVLTGIHAYLGFHVISRKVIFVDLALAQIAAFGVAYAALLNYEIGNPEDATAIYLFSLVFTFVGAALFALTRMRHERVPHEAIIGIIYAVASAATILAMVNLGRGAEQMKQLLTGSILWLQGGTVLKTAVIYSLVGVFHYVFRRQFLLISIDPARAEREGLNLRLWDFLFYISFGFVITSSVAIAGVLLVFSYLVVPSTIAILFSETLRGRLALGWITGSLVSVFGIVWAYESDLPAGPAIVVTFGIALLLAGVFRFVLVGESRVRRILSVGLFSLLFTGFFLGTLLLKKGVPDDIHQMLTSSVRNERLIGIRKTEDLSAREKDPGDAILPLVDDPDPEVRIQALRSLVNLKNRNAAPKVEALLEDPDDRVREAVIRSLRVLGRSESFPLLLQAAGREGDDFIKTEIGETLLELGSQQGILVLLHLMDEAIPPQARKDAYEHLTAHIQVNLTFDASLPPGENDTWMEPWFTWWEEKGPNLDWDPDTGIFLPSD